MWTIGHSTRSLDELAALLESHGISCVADVRRFPGSRKHPQFGREALERGLAERGIAYVWLGEALGGRRRAGPEAARHAALRSESFRAYAAHMQTPEFAAGLERLVELAGRRPTAILCSEAVWWRCHRSMIADRLVSLGHEVRHVMSEKPAGPHRLKAEARAASEGLIYDVAAPSPRGRPATRQQTVSNASPRRHGTRRRARL